MYTSTVFSLSLFFLSAVSRSCTAKQKEAAMLSFCPSRRQYLHAPEGDLLTAALAARLSAACFTATCPLPLAAAPPQ